MQFRMRCAALAVLLTALAIAPAPSALAQAAQPAPASRIEASPAIWRVTDEDSEIYILGTFHVLPPNTDWRSPVIASAIEASDTIWFEAEVDTPAARQKTVQILMTQGFNPDGGVLTEMLTPADAQKLRTVANEVGLPLSAVDPMRPWQAFLALSVQFVVSQGFDPGSGVESSLLAEARLRGKELRFFETVEEQLGFFTTLPPAAEKALLVTTLRDWDQHADEFGDLFDAWRTGDVETIDQLMNESLREAAPIVHDVLVTRRNAAWAETIAAEMAGAGTQLVAVGAGHLVGEKSTPALLKAKGFKVERIDARAQTAANDNDAIGDLLENLEDAQ